jgi:hypothetical protein
MGRSYSDQGYGSRKDIGLPSNGSIDGTYQSAVDLVRHTFMFPATVVDWNMAIGLVGGTDLGADVYLYLGKSLGGTGAVTAIGTWDTLQGTGTHAGPSVVDQTVTETSFTAGDDVVLQAIGTIGHAMTVCAHVEFLEKFEEADS